jgi:hypothetical protein
MAKFILRAMPATFVEGYHGALMVTVPMLTPPLIRREVDVKTEAEAVAVMAEAQAELERIGVPYSLRLNLADKRAPRGFKSWGFLSTRFDNPLGVIAER